MCMVSVISNYGQTVPVHQWTPSSFYDFQEVIRRLEALDKKLDQPHCEDPAKAAWMREVEERLKKLETPPTPEQP